MNNRIAIIDSGIDRSIYKFDNIIGGVAFDYDISSGNITQSNDITDFNGHGTKCTSVIQMMNKDLELYIIKILDENMKTNTNALIMALEHLLDVNIKIINLSLSTSNEKYKDKLYDICEKLNTQKKIIICSSDNETFEGLPSKLPNVIGVRRGRTESISDFLFNPNLYIQCVANGKPVVVQNLDKTYCLEGGNSISCAIFSGIVSKYIKSNSNINYNELINLLEKEACKNTWNDEDLFFNVAYNVEDISSNYDEDKLSKLKDAIVTALDVEESNENLIYINTILDARIGFNIKLYEKLTKSIEGKFKININHKDISIDNLISIYTIYDYLAKCNQI